MLAAELGSAVGSSLRQQPAEVVSTSAPTTSESPPIWPLIVGLTTAPPLPPRPSHPPAEDPEWPREQYRLRKRRLARTTAHEDALDGVLADDSPDTIAWESNATAFEPLDGGGESSIWSAICNSTSNPGLVEGSNATEGANSSNGTNSSIGANSSTGAISAQELPESWPLVEETFCALQDVLEGNFSDLSAAMQACGKNCSAVQDVGCEGREFRLCRIGASESPSKTGTCLRKRARRGPKEEKFWREFCARHVVHFRLLFPGRRCAEGKVLQGAFTEIACAEAAKADPGCSKFFDVRMAAPPPEPRAAECRCLPKDAQCSAAEDPTRDVFVLG